MHGLKFATCLLAWALLSGCASREPAPASWMGAPEAEVRKRFGTPAATLVNEDGNEVLVFTAASTFFFDSGGSCNGLADDSCRLRGNLVLNQEATGQRAIVARCSLFFEFNRGAVVKWTWGGRLCNRVYDSGFHRDHHRAGAANATDAEASNPLPDHGNRATRT